MENFVGSGTSEAPFVLQSSDCSMFRPIETCPASSSDSRHSADICAARNHMRDAASYLYRLYDNDVSLADLGVPWGPGDRADEIINATHLLVLARHTLNNMVNPLGFPRMMSLPHPENLRRWYRREVDYVAHWVCVECRKVHPRLNQVVLDATPAVIICPNRKCLNHWFNT